MTCAPRADALSEMLPRLVRRARRYTGDPTLAEDLAQEALLRVWIRLEREPPVDDVQRYLHITLRNLVRRRRPVMDELSEALMPVTEPAGDRRLATAEVLRALSHLPDAQATLILDHAIDGVSYAELARRHRIPIGTVMSRVARGRARLRERFDLPKDAPFSDLLETIG